MAWLLGLLAGIAALIVGVVMLLLSIVAAMPWLAPSLAIDAATAEPPAVIHIPAAEAPAPAPVAAMPATTTGGNYSMADKFQLLLSLGASQAEAVLLTAICTAENGSGSPTAINHNRNAPDDVGLCQINAMHVPALAPSYQSLEDPVINAGVALRMLRSGSGPLQWCTYPGGCGGLPGVPNWTSLLRQAQAVAGG